MRRRLSLPVLVLAVASSLAGCLSPTLPLPPPEQPSIITAGVAAGTWDVRGDCTPGARVTVFNEKTGRGVVVEDRSGVGRYQVTLEGAECDLAWVEEEVDQELSAPTGFVLAKHLPGDPTDNPACHVSSQ
jgi:hypothetical protein